MSEVEKQAKTCAILKYMDLRIKGFGVGLSEQEIAILQNMSKEEDNALFTAILELGGSLPNGIIASKKLSTENKALFKVFQGLWRNWHHKAVTSVVKKLKEA